jgi:Flp pilus assembly protein TadG
MRPRKREAAAAAIIRHRSMARGVIACAWRFARFKAAKAKSLGERGAALVEFALLAPVLLLILLGTAQFGLTLNQYVMLTNAVGVGAMQFAVSRSDTTPYTDAVNAVKAAATTLTPANLTITLSVGSPLTACGTDAACATALTSNVGQPAQVSATYPCNLHVMLYNFAPTCNLTFQVTERVQ